MRFAPFALVVSCAALSSLLACVGDEPTPGGSSSGGTSSSGGSSGASSSGGSSGAGSSGTTSSSGTACSPSCDGATLKSCGQPDVVCDLGCVAAPTAHCGKLNPTGEAAPSDLAVVGVGDITLDANLIDPYVLDTDTGEIVTLLTPSTFRAANANPTQQEVVAGIGFRKVAGKIGIFQFKSLTVKSSRIRFRGSLPVAVVAQTTINLESEVQVRPCDLYGSSAAGLGGAAGGTNWNSGGSGPGGGAHGELDLGDATTITTHGGASGAGYFALGGAGAGGTTANGTAVVGTVGGQIYGSQTSFEPFIGGSGGGGPMGGAGGGAILLAAGTKITIGGATDRSGGINAGGCVGVWQSGGTVPDQVTRGGGGSGGTILVEAPVVEGGLKGVLAANGASGTPPYSDGTGDFTYHGQFGSVASATFSPSPYKCAGANGAGGFGSSPAGKPGGAPPLTSGANCASTVGSRTFGGGGGGSVGRIRILTKSGTVNTDATFVYSPSTTTGATTIGTIALE